MFATDFYLPSFFLQCYPLYKSEYGVLMASILFFGGLTSSMGGGILADKL